MKSRAQPSSCAVVEQGASVASLPIAARARPSAASAYCDATRAVTSDPALLSKRPARASTTNPPAGLPVSPRRSRTVLLNSRRVRRRSGEATTPELAQAAVAGGVLPVEDGVAPALPGAGGIGAPAGPRVDPGRSEARGAPGTPAVGADGSGSPPPGSPMVPTQPAPTKPTSASAKAVLAMRVTLSRRAPETPYAERTLRLIPSR